jgi:ribosomal protein S18 acetylase RimI-like enzyme
MNEQTLCIDEHALTVREIEMGDVDRLRRMFGRLSADSVYRRFFSPIQSPSRSALLWLATVDHQDRDALVALDGDEIVAVARYDARAGSHAAEIAVTVEDAWQHRGLGKRLAKRLARRAIDRGFESFEATVLPDNRPALGLLRKLSPDASVRFDAGSYAASMRLIAAPSAGPPSQPDGEQLPGPALCA